MAGIGAAVVATVVDLAGVVAAALVDAKAKPPIAAGLLAARKIKRSRSVTAIIAFARKRFCSRRVYLKHSQHICITFKSKRLR